MIVKKEELANGLARLREKFSSWNPDQLALVANNDNHLVEGKNFLGWLRSDDEVENLILDVLEQFSQKSETIGVGSAINVAKNILSGILPKTFEEIQEDMKKSRYPMQGDFENIIDQKFDLRFRNLLKEILYSSESDANVFLKREHVMKIIIEKMDGYIFSLSSAFNTEFDERNVQCVVIDGFVESVGEIHHILEHFSQSKIPGIIFARNFANDVITTLQHNKLSGRMNLLPILVTFNVEDLNTLVDLAVISGGSIVSSDKGELIKSIVANSLPAIDRAIYKNGKLVLINSKTASSVSFHLKNLRKKIDEIDEFRKKLYEYRLSSLSPNCLKISIPIGKKFDDVESSIDLFLRMVRSALLFGIVEVDEKIIPSTSYLSSTAFTKKFLKLFQKEIGAAIIE